LTRCHRPAVAQHHPLTTIYELLFPEAFMSAARVPSNPVQAHGVEEKIRIRAYLLFEKRGREHGHDFDDWLQAEAEIQRGSLSAPPVRLTPAKKSRTKRTNV
jgi:hypothetical protein